MADPFNQRMIVSIAIKKHEKHKPLKEIFMEQTEVFKIVIAYNNLTAAIRAKKMAERLAAQLESEWDIWPFELLNVGHVREYAANTAVQSNMFIIATDDRDDLPNGVKDWIESWLPKRTFVPAVLVGLLDDEGKTWDEPPPVYTYLNQIARRENMDFICNLGPWWKQDQHETSTRPSEPNLAWLQDAIPEYSAMRGWGIND